MKWIGIFLAVLLLAGCGHKVTEQDVIGKWNVDPAASKVAGKIQANIDFAADHTFAMAFNQQLTVKGSWQLVGDKVALTPTTLQAVSPFNAAQTVQMPMETAVKSFPDLGATPEQVKSLDEFAKPTVFTIASDGKRMTESGNPALVKSQQ